MKRFLTVTLTLTTLFALTAPAFADLMWEPDNNSFYNRHRNQCEYENRSYYANGKEGFVTAWDAPDGSLVVDQYGNGEKLWIYYIYENWGLISRWDGGKETSGWISLSDLSLVYDYISFEEEYADRITPYSDEFADYNGDAEVVNFYEYPGAPGINQSWEISGEWHVLDNLTGTADNPSYISSIFVDENGLTWGFIVYMYGRLNSWFCLDEPDGTDFPVREVSTPQLTPARTPALPTRSYIPYILVAAVVAVTGGILIYFYGRKRKSTD